MRRTPANPTPTDQAAGLRRLFEGQQRSVVPVVANALVNDATPYLDALARALLAQGASVLVVDASDTAPQAQELIDVDLALCIERPAAQLGYLAAPGAARRHVDARGSAQAWLWRVQQAAPWAQVVLLHADMRDLPRLTGHGEANPVLICATDTASLTEAYAGMKLLVQRAQCHRFDVLVGLRPGGRVDATAVALRLDGCADTFLGAAVRACAAVPLAPRTAAATPVAPDLLALAAMHLAPTWADTPWPITAAAGRAARAALAQ